MKPKLWNGFLLACGAAVLVLFCGTAKDLAHIVESIIFSGVFTFYIYWTWER